MSDHGERAQGEIRIHLFGRTDVGQIREHNEDNFLVADLTRRSRSLMEADRHQVVAERGTVLAVCDGMGGAAAGEVASQMAVDIIYEKLAEGDAPTDRDDLARRLVRAVEEAGQRIFSEARADRSRRGMGTTATVAALIDSRLFMGQVGDSRAYILRNNRLTQVTRDQSLVNQLIEAGQLTEEEAETFEHNNIILQALGTADSVQVDLTYADLRQGDVLMVCSDGLSGMLRADDIREILVSHPDPLEACKVLTDRANLAGGHDNITVIVARFEGDLPEPGPDETLAYTKYAISNLPSADATVRAAPIHDPDSAELSEEAARESRRLRVSHTMVGGLDSAALQAAVQARTSDSNTPPRYDPSTDPIDIPTTGLPPAVVGLLVLGALCVAAIAGGILALS
ncbi:MAG: Stp1/IreP family PP2C-type Ser/Thr phosphatase [Polyangiaceae bacterium]|nr:Stp1/IreP family PP2C-type Ser/Thr phosphatase [Polyangiaceae bacterium]MCW5790780.1 Stp1/IreP family PP2C-type Ser/Thr phosphatase [Polyangiaceae bacterium]